MMEVGIGNLAVQFPSRRTVVGKRLGIGGGYAVDVPVSGHSFLRLRGRVMNGEMRNKQKAGPGGR
jgi:hypothetical protein